MKKGHITKEEQMEIYILLNKGYNKSDISKALDRCHTTIGREIKRNSENGVYSPRRAAQKARNRRKCSKYQGMKVRGKPDLEKYVKEKLKLLWTPEKISGRIKNVDTHLPYISTKGIYKWIYSCFGQAYHVYLPKQRHKPKKRRRKKKGKREMIPNRVGIENRPEAANKRTEYGHWEGDSVVSGKKHKSKISLCVISERKARYVGIKKVRNLKPKTNNKAIGKMGKNLYSKTYTFDNGIENKEHEKLAEKMKIDIYFCDPYSSWQKGGVENVNGIIRRFIPKRANIADYSNREIRMIEYYLNHTPKKCLNYKTPYEVMIENNLFLNEKSSRMCV